MYKDKRIKKMKYFYCIFTIHKIIKRPIKMEASQSYYLHKEKKRNFTKELQKKYIYNKSILWAQESMRILTNNHSIQEKILLHYFPQLDKNIKYMKTFHNTEINEIKSYCEEIIQNNDIFGIIIIVISEYQIILIQKTLQDVYIIDPTSMLNIKSIHDISFLEKTILPIFTKNKYNCNYVKLTYPLQVYHKDYYSNTLLMILLVICLYQMYSTYTIDIIEISDKCSDKRKMITDFHKDILNITSIKKHLTDLFLEFISLHIDSFENINDLEFTLTIDPVELIINYE